MTKKGDLGEHVQLVDERLSYSSGDGAFKCMFYVLTLVWPDRLWFNDLPDGCINSLEEFRKRVLAQFMAWKRRPITEATLTRIVIEKRDILDEHIKIFLVI